MAKILLIDDDPDVRVVMSALLHKEGYDVATASRREEALQKIAEETPSLILLDVLLSGSDGRDLCREIKAGSATAHIPVIMLSGHPGAVVNFASYGADDFLTKPIKSEDLLNRLTRQMTVE